MATDFLIVIFLTALAIAFIYVVTQLKKSDKEVPQVHDQRWKPAEFPLLRGTDSERNIVNMLIDKGISTYLIYHDLYVPIDNEKYTQVDIVILATAGIIVVEDKDFSGWIFGKGLQTRWTQVLAYGKEKNQFYNPVRQNYGHIMALKQNLAGIVDVPFFSVITFSPNCTLRDVSEIPADTYICYSNQLKETIDKINATNPAASYGDNDMFTVLLNSYVSNGEDPRIVHKHLQTAKQKKLGMKYETYRAFYDSI